MAPVPIRYAHLLHDDVQELARRAVESSVPTHASPQCLSACRYFAVVLAGLIDGCEREDVLDPNWRPILELQEAEPFHWTIADIASGSFRTKHPPEIQGSGYVVKSLEAALWAFYDAADFEEAVLKSVNLGDDADTTGAVCGQLAGAFWGESQIPDALRTGLARMDMIRKALQALGCQ